MLSYDLVQIIIPLSAFMLNVVTQVVLLRLSKQVGLLKSIYYCFGLGLIALMVSEIITAFSLSLQASEVLPIAIANLLIYFALGYCYFNFINLGETARRIRILRELYESDGGLSMEEILQRYNALEIVQRRIGRLIRSGQVIEKNGRFIVSKPILLMIAKVIVAMKLLFLGKDREFDSE